MSSAVRGIPGSAATRFPPILPRGFFPPWFPARVAEPILFTRGGHVARVRETADDRMGGTSRLPPSTIHLASDTKQIYRYDSTSRPPALHRQPWGIQQPVRKSLARSIEKKRKEIRTNADREHGRFEFFSPPRTRKKRDLAQKRRSFFSPAQRSFSSLVSIRSRLDRQKAHYGP